jgi:hypothetical protein
MKGTIISFILLVLFGQASGQIIARSVAGPAGSISTAGAFQVSATVGEPVINTFSSSLIVTQGFQQADSLFPTKIDGIAASGIDINVYPNPFSDELFISINADGTKTFGAAFYNDLGQMVMPPVTWVVQGQAKKSFDLSPLAAGTYFVALTITGKYYKSYKITKLK